MDNYDKYITSSEYAININLAEVEECSGNLKKLLTQWSHKQCKFKSKFGDVKSTGYVADEIFGGQENTIATLDILDQLSENMTGLLENSISFFENFGFVFKETDHQLADKWSK